MVDRAAPSALSASASREAGAPPGPPPPGPPRSRSPVLISLLGKGGEFVTLLVLATVVPRVLGPTDYGVFSLALAVVTLSSASMALGGPTLMARYVPTVEVHERPGLARALFVRLARWRTLELAAIVVAAVIATLVAPERLPASLTVLVVAALAFSVLGSLLLQAGLGLGHTTVWSVRYPLQNAVLIWAVLALHASLGAVGAVAAVTIAYAFSAALGLATALRPLITAKRGSEVPPEAFRFGLAQAGAGLLVQLRYRGVVVVVAILAGSATESGYAAPAVGAALAAVYAVNQTFTVTLPARVVSSAVDSEGAEAASRTLAWRALFVLLPVGLIGALVLDQAVPLVFGEAFAVAAPAFAPALAAVMLAPLTALATQTAALRLRSDAAVLSAAVGAAALLIVAGVLVGPLGALGGTAGMLAGMACSAVTSMLVLRGAFGRRLPAVSLVGALAVLIVGLA